jgi:hypothetical protein
VTIRFYRCLWSSSCASIYRSWIRAYYLAIFDCLLFNKRVVKNYELIDANLNAPDKLHELLKFVCYLQSNKANQSNSKKNNPQNNVKKVITKVIMLKNRNVTAPLFLYFLNTKTAGTSEIKMQIESSKAST